MRLHRFYVGDQLELSESFWMRDAALLHQWQKVLRLSEGNEVVLFDGVAHERLYKITKMEKSAAHLERVTDFQRHVPMRDAYMFFSLLKKDNNELILQKCTELGIGHFVPILADRSEKKGFNMERAQRIVIEAAEQCGRSDIPSIREPMLLKTAVEDYKDKVRLLVCNQGEDNQDIMSSPAGALIGPEGGWSDAEKQSFQDYGLAYLHLGDFTLRGETAAITASAKLVQ
ncbi:MAG: RsmE family RNA methyltransferase [Candidatus Saccharibacteria bacterium]|nr:RsmE family RNA methyltransferase [Candidatus Saccharibacteria bacterium]